MDGARRRSAGGGHRCLAAAGAPRRGSTTNRLLAEASGRGTGEPDRRPRGGDRRPPAARRFGELVRRRLRREPVAYIVGTQRLPPDRARGRPPGAGAAAGDRAAGRGGAGAPAGERCSTSAPARGRSRWRSPTSCRVPRSSPPTPRPGALEVARANADAPRPRRPGSLRGRAPCPPGESFDLVLANLPYVAEARLGRRCSPR